MRSQISPVWLGELRDRFTNFVDKFVFVLHEEECDDDFDFKLSEAHAKTWVTT